MGDGTTNMTTVHRASYIKVGRLVTLDIDIQIPSYSGTLTNYIKNLPFSGGSGGGAVGYHDVGNATGFHITGASTSLYFLNITTGGVQNISGKRLIFSVTYHTA